MTEEKDSQRIEDPSKALEMAYAEKPHIEQAMEYESQSQKANNKKAERIAGMGRVLVRFGAESTGKRMMIKGYKQISQARLHSELADARRSVAAQEAEKVGQEFDSQVR